MTFMNTKFSLLLIPLLLACCALSPSIQAAPLNVNVVNTPTVNVATMPPLLIDSSNPVLVRDVDNPARQPFTFREFRTYTFGDPESFNFQVPTGKRLVIEQVSVWIAGGVTNLRVRVRTIFPAGQPNYQSYNFMGTQVIGPDNSEFIASSQMRCYADEGTTATIDVWDFFTDFGAQAEVTVSGYLIDLP